MTTQQPNFSVSRNDSNLIHAIVERTREHHNNRVLPPPFDGLTLTMDLCAIHNTNPLRLADLLAAPDFDFLHDVYGIQRHIDRSTGKLTDHFLPRFSQRKE